MFIKLMTTAIHIRSPVLSYDINVMVWMNKSLIQLLVENKL